MYLSKLELFGFKSFARKTKLKLTDGISCVIGPNGSGKTNIVDAIRWVLGEQRISNLRTDKMESIIFNGTRERKPLGMAEVSLTINDNRNQLHSEFTDIVVSRRLYRSGESHYLINKVPCRLKDIIDLFMDTGIGANSYSVIELNMVESIISENPAERRHLFEEAAGVTKYKGRRKSALRKLEYTRQDMSRVNDLISEISRTVNSLSRQVGKARRYLKFQDQLKNLEVDVSRFKFTRYLDEIEPLKRQLTEISHIKEDTSHQITLEEALLEEYKREILQIEENIRTYSTQISDIDREINQVKEEEAVASTRRESLHDTINRNHKDIKENQEKEETLQKNLNAYRVESKKLQKALGMSEQEQKKKELEFKKEEVTLREDKKYLEEISASITSLMHKITPLSEHVNQSKYQIKWNHEQLSQLGLSTEQEKEREKAYLAAITELQSQSAEISRKIKTNETTAKKNRAQYDQFLSEIEKCKEEQRKVKGKEESIQARLMFFKQVIAAYEGHAPGTQSVMKNKQDFAGLHGPLSDLLHADSKYQNVVESALGDTLDYLVVDTVESAKTMLAAVRNGNYGRITLLPLDRIQSLATPQKITIDSRIFLSELIKCDSAYTKIIELLLGDMVLVEDLEDGLKLSNEYPQLRYITKNGEYITRLGAISIRQLRKAGEISLIGRQDQVEKLAIEIEKLHAKSAVLEDELKSLSAQSEKLRSQIDNEDQTKDELYRQLYLIEAEEKQKHLQIESLTENAQKSQSESLRSKDLISQLELEVRNSEIEIKEREQELRRLETEKAEAVKRYETKNASLQSLATARQDAQLQVVKEQNQYHNTKSELDRTEQNIRELMDLMEKRKHEISEMEENIKQIDQQKGIRAERLSSTWNSRDEIEKQQQKFQQGYHELKDKILNLENQIKKYRKQHDSSLERTRQLELQIQEFKLKADSLKERIREEYNEDLSVGIAYDGLNIEESESEIEVLKNKIRQLGQVNPLAVSEYEKENERLTFYSKQYNDLEEAEKSLMKTINKINETARKQFLDTFNQIKSNFEKVFINFFENGEGTLAMEENSDPLESNIEILVRPKGKRHQTISLLSGGEKTLTAISLLFSIYLVKPSPFCILDEIDAPLDDVNISRFTRALREFSKDTQFIVVTHNKRTMESANTMYGVTMEEEGLSQLVSVKFN